MRNISVSCFGTVRNVPLSHIKFLQKVEFKLADNICRIIDYIIPQEAEGLKIEQFLRRKGYSRRDMTDFKKDPGCVTVNGLFRRFNERLHFGDLLTVRISETEWSDVEAVPLPLEILYEDEDLVAVNKPAGMPTHPSIRNYDNSLANALMARYLAQGRPFVFRCCNRLDRDTSGVTIVAKHSVAAGMLSQMGTRRELHREYLAIVRGKPEPESGTIDAPLGRKPGSIIERMVDPENGETAVTHYKVLKTQNGHSLVSLELETGRTHQIRIHMKHLGYPLIGDYLYNPDMEYISRQALHSCRMSFRHPITGKMMSFCAPLPDDMRQVLEP